MSLRGRIIAGTVVAGLLVGVGVAWPMIENAAARALEKRLQEETGRPWSIGGLSIALKLKPDLVARDITVGEPNSGGLVGTIKQVRLADALSLMGSSGSVRAEAEGLSLRVPSAAPPAKSGAAGRSPAKVSSVRVNLRGPAAELADSGKTLVVSADAADITLDLADSAPRTEVKAKIESADYTADIAYTAAAAQDSGPLTVTLDPRSGRGHRASANANARFAADGIRLDQLSGTIDGAPFTGTVAVGLGGPKPQLALDLRLDALTLTDEGTANPEVRVQNGGVVVSVPPDLVPDVRWFEGFEGKGSVSVARLHVGNAGITDATVAGTVKGGMLDAALSSAALYAGQARGRYVLTPEKGTGRHQLSLSLAHLRALPMLWDLASVRGLDGTGNARVDLQATGGRLDDLVRTLYGHAEISLADGRIDGLDLASALGFLPGGNRSQGSSALATRLDGLTGSFALAEGQAITNDFQLRTGLINATGVGRIDLPGRTLDFHFKPQVAAAGGGGDRPRGRLDVPVRVSGPWTNPNISADLSGLAQNPGAAMQSLQDLGTNLMDKKNGGGGIEGLGNALGDLLGGGGGQGGGQNGGGLGGLLGGGAPDGNAPPGASNGGNQNGGALGDLLDSFMPKPGNGPPGPPGPPANRARPPEPYRAPR